jgi:hypothetical protein
MSDELRERKILKLILIVRFACATLDVGRPILIRRFSPIIVAPGLLRDASLDGITLSVPLRFTPIYSLSAQNYNPLLLERVGA